MIKFDFSVNNTIAEFKNRETESTVYLGFSNPPETNIFSQKHFKSLYGSTTETLVNNYKLLDVRKEKDYTAMIHLVQGWATLDVATAAMALKQDSKELKSSDWVNLANYISEMEKGFTTPPFMRSLYSFFYATVKMVSHNQEFEELPNCKMQWIDDKTAKILLPGEGNDFTNERFVSISGATEETCNGQFKVLKASPKELMIQRLTDHALNTLIQSVEDSYAKSLIERMNQQKRQEELKTLWDKVIDPESKSLPVGDKVKLNDFYRRMINNLAWGTGFKDQQIQLIGDEKLKSRNLELLSIYHEILEAFLKEGGVKGPDVFRNFMDLVPRSFSITAQEEILNSAKEEFIIQDYLKAENFEVDLPLKNVTGNQTHQRVPLLGLVEPQSTLFKFFARNPMIYPRSLEQVRYPMTYVNNPKNNGKTGEHIISVPPSEPYNLKGLSELLEEIEDRARKEKREDPRPKDEPRDGIYKYNEPWYDERHSNYSIIDNPKDGSRLEISDVIEAIWYFGNPLERIEVDHATTSIFIPFWEYLGNNKGKSIFNNREQWEPVTYKDEISAKLNKKEYKISHAFLPFVEQIFDTTDQDPDAQGSLQAWKYQDKVKLNLNPLHLQNYGPAVSEIREIEKEKVKNMLENAEINLKAFSYEFGFGLLDVDIQLPKGCSIMQTQWIEHLISITECRKLLKGNIDNEVNPELELPGFSDNEFNIEEGNIFLLMPDKHYACTTLSHFDLKGGSMTDCRSLGGGLQMVVNDAEPLFHNLPKEKRLKTKQTVVDEVTKRHFYCSSSSILNFDDVAFKWEHVENHTFASMLFNMVLAQRFILAQARRDIVQKEWEYSQNKKDINFIEWFKNKLKSIFSGKKDQQGPEEKIAEIRDDIQHMTTSSWFNVVSSDSAIQEVFLKLRDQMNVNEFYTEVQERCKDLDEFIAKKQASVQSRVFDIFTFVMSPLSLVVGFMGGTHLSPYFARVNEDTFPFPFFDLDIQNAWIIFLIYGVFFSILFLLVWILYKYKSFKA